jgi:hypothetical protein
MRPEGDHETNEKNETGEKAKKKFRVFRSFRLFRDPSSSLLTTYPRIRWRYRKRATFPFARLCYTPRRRFGRQVIFITV